MSICNFRGPGVACLAWTLIFASCGSELMIEESSSSQEDAIIITKKQIQGSIEYGTSVSGRYLPFIYTGYEFEGRKGDFVTIEVDSPREEPKVGLYLAPTNTLAGLFAKPLAEARDKDFVMLYNVPLPQDGRYLIMLKNYKGRGSFSISLSKGPLDPVAHEVSHDCGVEWWYYTGLVHDKDDPAAQFGFELVIFEFDPKGPLWGYLGNCAITDLSEEEPKFVFGWKPGFSKRQNAEIGFDVHAGSWRVMGHAGHDQLFANTKGYEIEFDLVDVKGPMIQYDEGWMPMGENDEPFYYYTYPHMQVTGTMKTPDGDIEVTGDAWMDHQWGNPGMFDYIYPFDKAGHPRALDSWEWYSIRLDNDDDIMLFVTRDDNGDELFRGGTISYADGETVNIPAEDIEICSLNEWTSNRTDATYPQDWVVSLPSIGIQELNIDAVSPDSELNHNLWQKLLYYWEGLCSVEGVTDDGVPLQGYAFVELEGYPFPH